MLDLKKLIGMTTNDAQDRIQKENLNSRIVRIDGLPCIITRDYRTDRVNLEIYSGIVTNVHIG